MSWSLSKGASARWLLAMISWIMTWKSNAQAGARLTNRCCISWTARGRSTKTCLLMLTQEGLKMPGAVTYGKGRTDTMTVVTKNRLLAKQWFGMLSGQPL